MIPDAAIERFNRLRQRTDDIWAAVNAAQQEVAARRQEAARHESMLQALAGPYVHGNRVHVDEQGAVYVRQPTPGGEERTVLRDDNLARVGRQVANARRRLGEAAAHRDHLAESVNGLSELVQGCARLLRRRGWREDPDLNLLQGVQPSRVVA